MKQFIAECLPSLTLIIINPPISSPIQNLNNPHLYQKIMEIEELLTQLKGKDLEEQFDVIAGLSIHESRFHDLIDMLYGEDRDAYFKAYARFGDKCVDPEFRFVVKSMIENGYDGTNQISWVVN